MTVFKDSSSKVIKIFSTFTALVFSCTFYGVSVMMDVLRDTIQAPNSAFFIPVLFSRKASLTASLSMFISHPLKFLQFINLILKNSDNLKGKAFSFFNHDITILQSIALKKASM